MRYLRELVLDFAFGPRLVWPTLVLFTIVGIVDLYLVEKSALRDTFNVSNWIVVSILCLSWWVVWLAFRLRR